MNMSRNEKYDEMFVCNANLWSIHIKVFYRLTLITFYDTILVSDFSITFCYTDSCTDIHRKIIDSISQICSKNIL